MNLKDLTWEHHKNAERQEFVKELLGGITPERYATFLFNQHPQYNLLEAFAMLHNLLDVRIAPKIHEDFQELWKDNNQPPLLPVVKDYMDHLLTIKDDSNKLMAHLYVRHMGDLSGGQMIAKKVPGSGSMYKFDKPVDELKEIIRSKCTDEMAEEAKLCFDFATRMFQEMMDIA
jgi:heme oxygenase